MDIVVKSRNTEVTDRFRSHVADKLVKIEKLDPKVISVDVECSQEKNPRLADQRERIEITIRSRGPVMRAEANAQDCYAALDLAMTKLEARLRRAHDRRKVHHGAKTPQSVAAATAALDGGEVAPAAPDAGDAYGTDDDGPLFVREKVHAATPIKLEQALYEMELVGHDFYLFVDADTEQTSVVYRRRAYDYGVIRLAV
ncbi:MAG: ribosome-associated translation inhibitor RaiA [Sporichthyaceae bacterium]